MICFSYTYSISAEKKSFFGILGVAHADSCFEQVGPQNRIFLEVSELLNYLLLYRTTMNCKTSYLIESSLANVFLL